MTEDSTHVPAVVSVNVSPVKTIEYGARTITTSIFKEPIAGAVATEGTKLHGDTQADRKNHGGPYRALYAYAEEDYRWWEATLGRTLPPGKFGENLTLRGIDITHALIGERWQVGSAVVQVSALRVPCYKLAMKMDDPGFIKKFTNALRPGAYLSIVEHGTVAAGDSAAVIARPEHGLTIEEMGRIYFFEHDRIAEMLVPESPPFWRTWAEEHS